MLTAQRTISGKVIAGDDNTGLFGATIVVKGTSVGTSSDVDGNFTLAVAADASTLVVSSVGFLTREIDITTATTVEVTLPVDAVSYTHLDVYKRQPQEQLKDILNMEDQAGVIEKTRMFDAGDESQSNTYLYTINESQSVENVITLFEAQPYVKYAQPNYLYLQESN